MAVNLETLSPKELQAADSTTKCTTAEGDIENALWRTEV